MKSRIMYIECKSGGLNGKGRIGRVTFSKTGATLYYDGKSFQSLKGGYKRNYFDVETGEDYWISGPKKSGGDRLYGGDAEFVDADCAEEYWTEIRGLLVPGVEKPKVQPKPLFESSLSVREREELLVDTFILPAKRERYRAFLANPKKRPKLLNELNHNADLDPRFESSIHPKDDAVAMLRSLGAPDACHLISDIKGLDGLTMPLEEAMRAVAGGSWGTLVGCIDGRLAFYHGECAEYRAVLERKR